MQKLSFEVGKDYIHVIPASKILKIVNDAAKETEFVYERGRVSMFNLTEALWGSNRGDTFYIGFAPPVSEDYLKAFEKSIQEIIGH
jgi:hypothetical protein